MCKLPTTLRKPKKVTEIYKIPEDGQQLRSKHDGALINKRKAL